MTNEEKAREIASKYERWNQEDDESYGAYNGAIEMAEWKEQQMIDKACEWLKEYGGIYWMDDYDLPTDELVNDFKKAMKGEEE